jgi:exodeoxyribonuclease-1
VTTPTYLFYDIESTGLNKAFDQVLHFAAIRTDIELQEIERYDIKIKLNPDIIPAPRALITHYIGIEESQQGEAEHPAMLQIHALFNEPGTISLGYNTLGFDDEFLRFSFYRNLLPPYTHQFANRCSRMDLYPIAILYFLYKNDVIHWPVVDGKPSFKLENINAANHFFDGRSHHAMVDVEVTLALARKLFAAREMWHYVTSYFDKNKDQERIQQLPVMLEQQGTRHYEGVMVYGKMGAANLFHAPVLYIGNSLAYKNQSLWLRLDTPTLTAVTPDTIADSKLVIRKKWGEPGLIVPPKDRFLVHLSAERQALARDNKAWLLANPTLFQQIIHYYRHYTYPEVMNIDTDASLYVNSFWSNEENAFCRRFNQSRPQDKSRLADNIQNPVLQQLALRLLGRNYPELLSTTQEHHFADYLQRLTTTERANALIDWQGNQRLSPQAALDDIALLRKETPLNDKQQQLLGELEQYIRVKFY